MNKEKLINQYEKMKANKKRVTSVDLVLKDLRSLDDPEPLSFKLKDVVGRIRGFDPTTQTIWLNTILKELGGDYGLMKYRSGYEQGKLEGAWVGNQLKDADKIRQELNKPVIPQFVAEIIEYYKKQNATLYDALREKNFNKQYAGWLLNEQGAYDKVARAWLDGYKVEEEKRYLVKMKGVFKGYEFLTFKFGRVWIFSNEEENEEFRTAHTRKELEEANFGWVFDCPGIEIEEVKE